MERIPEDPAERQAWLEQWAASQRDERKAQQTAANRLKKRAALAIELHA